MIAFYEHQKMLLNIPDCLTMENPWRLGGVPPTLKAEEIPLYRHEFTRVTVVAHPFQYLLRSKEYLEAEGTFEEWITGHLKTGVGGTCLEPFSVSATVLGVLETDIIVDANRPNEWLHALSRRFRMTGIAVQHPLPRFAYSLEDILALGLAQIKSPSNGQRFMDAYGDDITVYNALEGQPFMVA